MREHRTAVDGGRADRQADRAAATPHLPAISPTSPLPPTDKPFEETEAIEIEP